MKRFAEFLRESKIDEELDRSESEIYSIDLERGLIFEGTVPGDGDDVEGVDPFAEIADASWEESMSWDGVSESAKDGGIQSGFGGEEYFSLDFPELVQEAGKKPEGKEDSKTLKDLLKSKEDADALSGREGPDPENWTEIARRQGEKYLSDGTTLMKRDEGGEPHPLTPEQVEEVVAQKTKENKYSSGTKIYEFSDDGRILIGKVPPANSEDPEPMEFHELVPKMRKKFLETLNDKVNSEGIHFRWIGDGPRLQVNSTSWVEPGGEDDPRDKERFDRAEYVPVVDPANPGSTRKWTEKVLSVVNASAERKSGKPKPGPYSTLEWKDGKFFLHGEPMDAEQVAKLAVSLNGGVGGDTNLLNPKGWGKKTSPYWESYKISVAGSKIGKAVNFNLPPVTTCAKGVPCAREGCYAIKAYASYPSARSAMKCNLALLRSDPGFELFKKSMILALTIPTKAKVKTEAGHKFTMCRFHVNGDLGVRGQDVKAGTEYLGAICEIAEKCKDVKFWMYTKQYEILRSYKGNIPPNLCIIVSCWGKFNPFDVTKKQFKNGNLNSGLGETDIPKGDETEREPDSPDGNSEDNYAELAENFPLAYLDDGSETGEMINMKIQERLGIDAEPKVCPCTDSQEIITRCETCKLCFDGSLRGTNLAFRKH